MKIVIAAGIYPPEVGGPALYAKGVKEALEKEKHETALVLFSDLRRYPSGVRHALYTYRLFRAARGANAIFAFDTMSVGLPAVLVGVLRRIPVVIRVGGDFVWERYVERTHHLIPLPHFYEKLERMSFSERIAFELVGFVIRHGNIVFNSRWLLDIWKKPYKLEEKRCHVVENVIGERLSPEGSDGTILLYGRNIMLKNSEAFRHAFEKARREGVNLTLEEGIMSHEQFIERVRRCYAIAIPSLSEVAPNSVIDALRCGKPFLLTKYSGYAEVFKEYGVIVDPLSEDDMARGIKELADEKTYERLQANIAKFSRQRSYEDVAREFVALIASYARSR